jgi:hypothetical protein
VLLRAVNSKEARALSVDKRAFARHCEAAGLPMVPTLATLDRRTPDDPTDGTRLDAWVRLARTFPARVFIKHIDGSGGLGSFVAARTHADGWSFGGRSGSAADLHAFCMAGIGSGHGWIVQPMLEAHPDLRAMSPPGTLGTLRVISCLPNEEPEVLFAVLRIPVGANITDNFGHGLAGNLVAPIDIVTGELGVARGSTSRDWPTMVDVHVHPDTGATIPGLRVPCWPETRAMVLAAQRSLPAMRTVGWDVAITGSGPMIIESNSAYNIDLVQVAYRRGLRTALATNRLERMIAADARTSPSAVS